MLFLDRKNAFLSFGKSVLLHLLSESEDDQAVTKLVRNYFPDRTLFIPFARTASSLLSVNVGIFPGTIFPYLFFFCVIQRHLSRASVQVMLFSGVNIVNLISFL